MCDLQRCPHVCGRRSFDGGDNTSIGRNGTAVAVADHTGSATAWTISPRQLRPLRVLPVPFALTVVAAPLSHSPIPRPNAPTMLRWCAPRLPPLGCANGALA